MTYAQVLLAFESRVRIPIWFVMLQTVDRRGGSFPGADPDGATS